MKRTHSYYKERSRSESCDDTEDFLSDRPSKRRATIYDAVAGKVTQAGLTGNVKNLKAAKQILRPDEVLFKQANAPIRYEESDYYYAHENLLPGQNLPGGDLLSALHAYASKLFLRTAESGTEKTWKCMDETALIAFGILMEETAIEKLGDTGDLAFTEADDAGDEKGQIHEGNTARGDVLGRSSRSPANAGEGDTSSDLTSSGDESSYATEESE